MYKSIVNELCQKNKLLSPIYTIVSRDGPAHNPEFVVCCEIRRDMENILARVNSSPFSTSKAAGDNAAYLIYTGFFGNEGFKDEVKSVVDIDELEVGNPVTVFIDGDNVGEVHEWVLKNRKWWSMIFFITKNAKAPENVKIYRSRTTMSDATDVRMMIYTMGYINIMGPEEIVVLVSRDKLFSTFVAELDNPRVRLVTCISDLDNM